MDKTNLSTHFKKLYIRPLGNVPFSLRSQSYTDLLQLRPLEKTGNISSFVSFTFGLLAVCELLTVRNKYSKSNKYSKKYELWHYQAKVGKRASQAITGVLDGFTFFASCVAKDVGGRAYYLLLTSKTQQVVLLLAQQKKHQAHCSCFATAAEASQPQNKAKVLLHFAALTTFACCPEGGQQIANSKQVYKKQTKNLQSSTVSKQQITPVLQTHFPFFNRSFDKKRLKLLLSWYYANKGEAAALAMVETLQKVGFSYAMKAGISLGVDDLKVPAAKVQFLEEATEALNATKAAVYNGSVTAIEEFQQFIDTWHRTSESLKQSVVQNFTMGLLRNNNSSSAVTSLAYSALAPGLLLSKKQLQSKKEAQQVLAYAPQLPLQSKSSKQQKVKQEENSDILEKAKEKNYRSYGDTLNPVYMMAFSGARGNLSQVRQLVGMRGLMADPQGQLVEFPIQSNFREGLTVTEYMISCYGARKGLVDTALRTAAAGYLTRRLVDVSHHQVVRSVTCSTKDGIFCKGRAARTSALRKRKGKLEETGNTALPPAWKIPLNKQNNSDAANATSRVLDMVSEVTKQVLAPQSKASEGSTAVTAVPVFLTGLPIRSKSSKQEQPKQHQEVKATDCTSPLVNYVGRVLARDIPGVAFRNQEIDISLSSAPLLREVYENFGIYLRSPLTCKASAGICQLCYGWGVSANQLVGIGEAVGVIAAQSIGEPGTQLTMRTFHTGGVFSGDIMEECRAKHPGRVSFHGAYLGLLVRTEGGRIAFCIKTPGILQVIGFPQEVSTSYSIAANTLLFVRQGEEVSTDSLLAQIPNLPTLEQKPGESTKTISSALSGEIRETPTISDKLGNIRILSGQKEPAILKMLPGSHRLGTCFLQELQSKGERKATSNIAAKSQSVLSLPSSLASNVQQLCLPGFCSASSTAVGGLAKQDLLTVRSKKSGFLLCNSTQLLLDLRYFLITTIITKTTLSKNQPTNHCWSCLGFVVLAKQTKQTAVVQETQQLLHFAYGGGVRSKKDPQEGKQVHQKQNRNPLSLEKNLRTSLSLFPSDLGSSLIAYCTCCACSACCATQAQQEQRFFCLPLHSKSFNTLVARAFQSLQVVCLLLPTNLTCYTYFAKQVLLEQKQASEGNKKNKQIELLKSNQQNRSNKSAKFVLAVRRSCFARPPTAVFASQEASSKQGKHSKHKQSKYVSYNNQNQVNNYVFQLVAQPCAEGEGNKNMQISQIEGRLGLKKSFSLMNCVHLFWKNSLLIRLSCDIWMQKGLFVSTFKYRLNKNWCSCLLCLPLAPSLAKQAKETVGGLAVLAQQSKLDLLTASTAAPQSRQNKTYSKNNSFFNSVTKNSEGKKSLKFATLQSYSLLLSDSKQQNFLRFNELFLNLSSKILSRFHKTPDISNTTNSDATKNTEEIVRFSLNSVAGELFPIQSSVFYTNPLAFSRSEGPPTASLPSSLAYSSSLANQSFVLTCFAKYSKEEEARSKTAAQGSQRQQSKNKLSSLLPASDYVKTADKKSVLTHDDRVSYNLVHKEEIISNNSVTSVAKQLQALCLPLAPSLLLVAEQKKQAKEAVAYSEQLTAGSQNSKTFARLPFRRSEGPPTASFASSLAYSAGSKTEAKDGQSNCISKEVKALTLNKQIGNFINQREEITPDLGSSYCGQIIEKSSSQITLRLVQNILYSDYSRRRAKVNKDLEKWVSKGTPVVTLPYSNSITGDIVAGIPKIEQLFEARGEALDKAVETLWASYKFTIRPTAKAVRECLKEIGLFVVQAIQKVYLSQGVHIADKHLEVIVRQMTRRVCITDPGDTSFLSEEFVDLQTIECVNWTTYGKSAAYRPRLIGITRASLNSHSFLSSASFQQTARVLERESFKEKTDCLLGLKERVMLGALIDAGTGGFRPEVSLNSLSNIYNFSSIGLKKQKKRKSSVFI